MNITCDKCGVNFQAELQASDIEKLLRNGEVMKKCINPDCKDFWGRHKNKRLSQRLDSYFYKSFLDMLRVKWCGSRKGEC